MDFAIIPRSLLNRFEQDGERRIHLDVLLSAMLLFIAAVLIGRYPMVPTYLPHVCLVQALFGIPCPGCGITRSVLAVLAGDLTRAWLLNPAGPLLCAATALQLPLRSLALARACDGSTALGVSRAMTSLVFTVMFANWFAHIF